MFVGNCVIRVFLCFDVETVTCWVWWSGLWFRFSVKLFGGLFDCLLLVLDVIIV